MPCWRFQALYKIREPFTIYTVKLWLAKNYAWIKRVAAQISDSRFLKYPIPKISDWNITKGCMRFFCLCFRLRVLFYPMISWVFCSKRLSWYWNRNMYRIALFLCSVSYMACVPIDRILSRVESGNLMLIVGEARHGSGPATLWKVTQAVETQQYVSKRFI